MVLRQLQQIVTQNADLNKFQQNVSAALNPLTQKQQLDSQPLLGVSLTQGIINPVAHHLNRVPISFTYVGYAQADVWNAQQADASFYYLMCSSDVVIDMMVF